MNKYTLRQTPLGSITDECTLRAAVDGCASGRPRPGEGSSDCDIGAFEWQLLGNDIFEDRLEDDP